MECFPNFHNGSSARFSKFYWLYRFSKPTGANVISGWKKVGTAGNKLFRPVLSPKIDGRWRPESNRNINNFRPIGQSNSYNNFKVGKLLNDYGYGNPVIIWGTTGFNNQLFRPIQYFIFYQFQNRVYEQHFFLRVSKQPVSNWSKSNV